MHGNRNTYKRHVAMYINTRFKPKNQSANPENDEWFMGPITLKELKKSLEIEPERIEYMKKMKRLEKMKNTVGSNKTSGIPLCDQENKENIPALTSKMNSTEYLASLRPLTPSNNSSTSSNDSNATYSLDSPTKELNTTYDLDETENINLQIDITQKTMTPRTKKSLDGHNYRQISHDSVVSEISHSNIDKTVDISQNGAHKEIEGSTTILSSFDNLKLDDVCGSLNDISMQSYTDSPLAKALNKSLTEMVVDYLSPSVKARNSSLASPRRSIMRPKITPGKISTTSITELKAEDCLVDFSFRSSGVQNQSTPDMFRKRSNDLWKSKTEIVTKKMETPLRSKIPLKKTPNKYSSIQSPVAKYIRDGIAIKSLSKLRHTDCTVDTSISKSKSESKKSFCRIPQYNHFSHNNSIKKKLNLTKMK